mmetsp:Transcript_49728/g.98262  ORF Transcript_49728/g.98262 Transcript_49728/m.98262 type:complete len:721 (-) Transcript_49728:965-3127(-)
MRLPPSPLLTTVFFSLHSHSRVSVFTAVCTAVGVAREWRRGLQGVVRSRVHSVLIRAHAAVVAPPHCAAVVPCHVLRQVGPQARGAGRVRRPSRAAWVGRDAREALREAALRVGLPEAALRLRGGAGVPDGPHGAGRPAPQAMLQLHAAATAGQHVRGHVGVVEDVGVGVADGPVDADLARVDEHEPHDVVRPDVAHPLPGQVRRHDDSVHRAQAHNHVGAHHPAYQAPRGHVEEEPPRGAAAEDEDLHRDRDLHVRGAAAELPHVDRVAVDAHLDVVDLGAVVEVAPLRILRTVPHVNVVVVHHRLDRGQAPKQKGHAHNVLHGGHVGALGGQGVVAADGRHGHVVEQRQQNHVERVDHLVVDADEQGEHHHDLKRRRHAVQNVRLQPLEDAPALHHRVEDGAQTGGGQDDVGCGLRGLRGSVHRDADLGLRQSGCVVDPVPRHAHHHPHVLQHHHHLLLVFREHLRKPVRVQNEFVARGARGPQGGARQDVGAQVDEAARFLGDVQVVPRDHLHVHLCVSDAEHGERRVLPRGIQHGHDPGQNHGPAVGVVQTARPPHRHGNRLVPCARQLHVHVFHHRPHRAEVLNRPLQLRAVVLPGRKLLGVQAVPRVQHLVQQPLRDDQRLLALRGLHHRALDDGVEPHELVDLVGPHDGRGFLRAEVLLEPSEHRLVDGVLLVVRVARDGRPRQHLVRREPLVAPNLFGDDGHVRRRQRSRFV